MDALRGLFIGIRADFAARRLKTTRFVEVKIFFNFRIFLLAVQDGGG